MSLLLAHFGHLYGLHLFMIEIPTYLSNIQHFRLKKVLFLCPIVLFKLLNNYIIFQTGILSALPFLATWIISIPIGIGADWLIQSDLISTRNVRRICNSIGCYISAVGLIGLSYTGCNQKMAVFWILLSQMFSGGAFSGSYVSKAFVNIRHSITMQNKNQYLTFPDNSF